MTEMNRSLANTLRDEVEAALQDVAAKHGLSIKMKNATFSLSSLVQKIEFATIGEDGVVHDRAMDDLIHNLWRFDMTEKDLALEYSHPTLFGGNVFKVVGYRARARKNPVTIQIVASEKRYVIPADSLRRCVMDSKDAA